MVPDGVAEKKRTMFSKFRRRGFPPLGKAEQPARTLIFFFLPLRVRNLRMLRLSKRPAGFAIGSSEYLKGFALANPFKTK